jgi:hypothetical protein
MDAGGLRTAVKPSRRTTDRGELHQPKKRGARQLAVPHTGAELVVNGSRKLISWRQGGFHRASQHVLDRLGVRVVVDASCEEGAGSPRSFWRWPHGRAKTPRDEPLDRCARRSTPSWPPRVARAVRPRCPREPGRPGRPRRAGPGSSVGAAAGRKGSRRARTPHRRHSRGAGDHRLRPALSARRLRSVPQLPKSDQRPDRRAHPVLVKIAPALVFVRGATTASTSAVTGSAHHHPNSALSGRPRSAAEET